jgi:hypothetical protein
MLIVTKADYSLPSLKKRGRGRFIKQIPLNPPFSKEEVIFDETLRRMDVSPAAQRVKAGSAPPTDVQLSRRTQFESHPSKRQRRRTPLTVR